MANEIKLTKTAAEKIKEYAKEENKKPAIRLGVIEEENVLMYELELADGKKDNEEEIKDNEISIYVNKELLESLKGTTIDYTKDETSEGFKINNPNMEHGCCGSGSCGSCDYTTDKKDDCCGGCC